MSSPLLQVYPTGQLDADVVCFKDHMNLSGDNPLFGPNDARHGPRFIDMQVPYTHQPAGVPEVKGAFVLGRPDGAATCATAAALGLGVTTTAGVPEALVARHSGMDVCVLGAVFPRKPLTREESVALAKDFMA